MSRRALHLLRASLAFPPFGASAAPIAHAWPQLQSGRKYASAPPDTGINAVLQSLRGAEFQKHLDYLRQSNAVLTYSQLLREFQQSVPAASERDAAQVCQALADSGSVIRHGQLVYLRPTEVLTALQRVLPTNHSALSAHLQTAQQEMHRLEQQRSDIQRRAEFRGRAANWAFFGALALQWGALFRLTYWELSWDVIEPIGFFMNGVWSLLSVGWFLRTQREFTYEGVHLQVMSNYERRAFERAGFDIRRLNHLKSDVERLTDALRAQQALAAEQSGSSGGEGGEEMAKSGKAE